VATVDGAVSYLWGDDRLVVADGAPDFEDTQFATYSVDGSPISGWTAIEGADPDCGVLVEPSGDADVVYLIRMRTTDAKGIQAATTTPYLVALNENLDLLWQVPLGKPTTSDVDCSGDTYLRSTLDGQWIAFALGDAFAYQGYLSTTTQKVTTTKTILEPLANLLVDINYDTCGSFCGDEDPASIPALDPATGKYRTFAVTGGSGKLGPGDVVRNMLHNGSGAYVDGSTLVGLGDVAVGDDQEQPWGVVDLDAQTIRPVPKVPELDGGGPVVDTDSGIVIAGGQVGISARTAAVVWDLGEPVTVCGAGHGVVVVGANDQIATLDSATGKQLSYSSVLSGCPDDGVFGGYGWDSEVGIVDLYAPPAVD